MVGKVLASAISKVAAQDGRAGFVSYTGTSRSGFRRVDELQRSRPPFPEEVDDFRGRCAELSLARALRSEDRGDRCPQYAQRILDIGGLWAGPDQREGDDSEQ